MNITEAWPTSLIDETELSYNGKGISSWEIYGSNNDVICSRFRATKFEKASKCNATVLKMIFSAVITPENVTEIKMAAFVEEPKEEVSEAWLPCPWGDQ